MGFVIRLPHDETDERKRYTFTDPDACAEAFAIVRRHHYSPHERAPTREEMTRVIEMASNYLDLTTYELGQECCVGKLRDIWRARRARGA